MQSAPSTVWRSMRRRRTIDHTMAIGASPTRSALRSAAKPLGSRPVLGAVAAMTRVTSVTSAARRTRPRATWAAERGDESRALQQHRHHTRPRAGETGGHERECREEQQENQSEAVLGALTEAGTAHELIVVAECRERYPYSAPAHRTTRRATGLCEVGCIYRGGISPPALRWFGCGRRLRASER